MEETIHKLAILYADVSGSTRITKNMATPLPGEI